MPKKTSPDPASLGARLGLGSLEAQVMEIIWVQGDVIIRDVYDALRQERDLAYTTVMSVVHNLHRKGLLNQRIEGNTHFYTAVQTKTQFIQSKVGDLLDALLEDFSEPTMTHLIERIRQADAARLAELERLISERRAQERNRDRE